MDRLIIDTRVLVALERGREIPVDVLPDDADTVIASRPSFSSASNWPTAGAGPPAKRRSTRL